MAYPKILSENRKCGCSIDFPISGHCRPTKNCSKDCYAKFGFQALPNAKAKHIRTSQYLASGKNLDTLVSEIGPNRKAVRLSGSGDLNLDHVPAILDLAKKLPQTQFWGMTRKTEIATALNGKLPNVHLLVSVDASSPKSTWAYPGRLCYGPRRPNDVIPDDPRIVTVFPQHIHGSVDETIPGNKKDCPAVRHMVDGCLSCGRCWKWN
jgi:hypothetical protein